MEEEKGDKEPPKHNLYSIDGDKDKKLSYVYFVHFGHSQGSAWIEIGSPKEIMSSADLLDIQNYLAHNTPFMHPMVTNWKLLRKDKV